MPDHLFWWLLTMACLLWYSVLTVYVSIKGAADIRHMLSRLAARRDDDESRGGTP